MEDLFSIVIITALIIIFALWNKMKSKNYKITPEELLVLKVNKYIPQGTRQFIYWAATPTYSFHGLGKNIEVKDSETLFWVKHDSFPDFNIAVIYKQDKDRWEVYRYDGFKSEGRHSTTISWFNSFNEARDFSEQYFKNEIK